MTKRTRLIVPEVVQTSNMDCGPAALKSLLDGFGIPVNYGRLREACQTDVDGTSIDTIEEVANQLGLQAEQIMLPADHILLNEARALPAIAVVVLPSGVTHFVIVWRRFGKFVELMDPAVGRRWVSTARFLSDLYLHQQPVESGDWRDYAGSEDFLAPLRRRLQSLGINDGHAIGAATNDPGWRPLAALDAGVRMLESLARSGAIDRGTESARVLEELLRHQDTIPEHYWSVRPDAANDRLVMRGAVLVRALGPSETHAPSSPELLASLQQTSPRPGHELLRLLRADGVFTPVVIGMALALGAAAVIVEAILFRGLLSAGRELLGAAIAFSAALLVLDIPLAASLLRFGRRLEIRLRVAFLEKLPRLGDRYFQSRLKSDMAERSHSIHLIRRLPEIGGQLLRYAFEIVFTATGIIWLDPASAPIDWYRACVLRDDQQWFFTNERGKQESHGMAKFTRKVSQAVIGRPIWAHRFRHATADFFGRAGLTDEQRLRLLLSAGHDQHTHDAIYTRQHLCDDQLAFQRMLMERVGALPAPAAVAVEEAEGELQESDSSEEDEQ